MDYYYYIGIRVQRARCTARQTRYINSVDLTSVGHRVDITRSKRVRRNTNTQCVRVCIVRTLPTLHYQSI